MEVLVILFILFVVGFIIKYRWDHADAYGFCEWCGKSIPMYRKTRNWYLKTGTPVYCNKKCQRADEASEGVKETRIRIIEGE